MQKRRRVQEDNADGDQNRTARSKYARHDVTARVAPQTYSGLEHLPQNVQPKPRIAAAPGRAASMAVATVVPVPATSEPPMPARVKARMALKLLERDGSMQTWFDAAKESKEEQIFWQVLVESMMAQADDAMYRGEVLRWFKAHHIMLTIKVSTLAIKNILFDHGEFAVVGINKQRLVEVQPAVRRWTVLQNALRAALANLVSRTLCMQLHLQCLDMDTPKYTEAGNPLCVIMAWRNVTATDGGSVMFTSNPPRIRPATTKVVHDTTIKRVLIQQDLWTPRYVMHLPVLFPLPERFLTTLNREFDTTFTDELMRAHLSATYPDPDAALLFVPARICVNESTFTSTTDTDSGMVIDDADITYCLSKHDVNFIVKHERNPWTGRSALPDTRERAAKMDIAFVTQDDWFSRVAYETNGPSDTLDDEIGETTNVGGHLLHAPAGRVKRIKIWQSEQSAHAKLQQPIRVYRGVYVRDIPIELIPLHVNKSFNLFARQPYSWTTDLQIAREYAAKGGTKTASHGIVLEAMLTPADILFDSRLPQSEYHYLANFSEVRTRPGVFSVRVLELSRHGAD